jgi:hypothetical protein
VQKTKKRTHEHGERCFSVARAERRQQTKNAETMVAVKMSQKYRVELSQPHGALQSIVSHQLVLCRLADIDQKSLHAIKQVSRIRKEKCHVNCNSERTRPDVSLNPMQLVFRCLDGAPALVPRKTTFSNAGADI